MKLSEMAKELEEMAQAGQLDVASVKLKPIKIVFESTEMALKEIHNG
jgi:hypothetical protein